MKEISVLTKGLHFTTLGNTRRLSNGKIKNIAYHSRKAGEGVLFVCIHGYSSDGHAYAADAYKKGSRIFVCERVLPLPEDACQLIVENSRIALAMLSAAYFDHPERKLRILGVTGTKGKSTVCEMIFRILNESGIPTGLIGTVGAKFGVRTVPTENTTPESYELYRHLSEMVRDGARYAVMEVSSQGVKLSRTYGISFFAAVFTNLTEDHIGETEHPDFEDYKKAKLSVFRHTEYAVLNAEDPACEEFEGFTDGEVLTYSTAGTADLTARDILPVMMGDRFGTAFFTEGRTGCADISLPMPGRFTVSNALAALAVCELCGIPVAKAAPHLADCTVAGRFEVVKTALSGVTFVIDYAHNGDSLRSALITLRAYHPARLICLFGSVGNRTKSRRLSMGQAAAELADFSILTSDNPDTEPPLDILRDIEAGMAGASYTVIPDRHAAIEYAVAKAEAGDVVLLAGKGHENYQLTDGKKLPFSEREILKSAVTSQKIISVG